MASENQVPTHTDILLDSFEKLQEYTSMVKFPGNLTTNEHMALHRQMEQVARERNVPTSEVKDEVCFPHFMKIRKALSGFQVVRTKDSDKRKRSKKVSIRILVEKNQSKYVVISPGLYDLLDYPEFLTFALKDSVLVVVENIPGANHHEVITGQHGFMINSASLVDCLCRKFSLLDFTGGMSAKLKQFKTSFEDYEVMALNMDNGDLTNFVFFYMAPGC